MVDGVVMFLFLAAAFAANVYVLVYAFRPWRATAAGRALMVKGIGNMLLLNMIVVALVWPDYPGRDFVRVVGMIFFTAGIWYLLIVLLRTPRPPRGR